MGDCLWKQASQCVAWDGPQSNWGRFRKLFPVALIKTILSLPHCTVSCILSVEDRNSFRKNSLSMTFLALAFLALALNLCRTRNIVFKPTWSWILYMFATGQIWEHVSFMYVRHLITTECNMTQVNTALHRFWFEKLYTGKHNNMKYIAFPSFKKALYGQLHNFPWVKKHQLTIFLLPPSPTGLDWTQNQNSCNSTQLPHWTQIHQNSHKLK